MSDPKCYIYKYSHSAVFINTAPARAGCRTGRGRDVDMGVEGTDLIHPRGPLSPRFRWASKSVGVWRGGAGWSGGARAHSTIL